MAMNFNELKLSLVDYLIRVEKYKPHQLSSNQTSYLINKRHNKQIVVVSIGEPVSDDKNIEIIKSEIKNGKRQRIEILNVAVSSDKLPKVICVSSIEDAIFNLKEFYPKIVNLKDSKQPVEDSDGNESQEEILEQLQNPNNSTNKKLKELVGRMNNQSLVSLIFSGFFLIMPMITLGFFLFMSRSYEILLDQNVASLLFGGTTSALTIHGLQVWRIFTYGFNVLASGWILGIAEMLLIGIFAIKVARFTEGVFGSWKFAVTVLITYPLAGFCATVMMPSAQFSGSMVFMTSIIMILGVTTWTKKTDAVQLYAKGRVIISTILLVIFVLFAKPSTEWVIICVAAGISGSIALLFTYDYSTIDGYLAFPLVILIAIVILPFALLLFPTSNLVYSGTIARTVLANAHFRIISIDRANIILNDNLGWRWFVYDDGGSLILRQFIGG